MAGGATPGQNTLRRSAAARIVSLARVQPTDLVVDIGAGAGALTVPLAHRARRVIAVEPDERLASRLQDRCRELGNVRIMRRDALGMSPLLDPYRVVANPPCGITSALPRSGARVPASDFFPPPGSDAAVLVAVRRDPALLPPSLRALHVRLVGVGLSQGSAPLRRVLRDYVSDRTWSRLAAGAGVARDACARALTGPQWAAVTIGRSSADFLTP